MLSGAFPKYPRGKETEYQYDPNGNLEHLNKGSLPYKETTGAIHIKPEIG